MLAPPGNSCVQRLSPWCCKWWFPISVPPAHVNWNTTVRKSDSFSCLKIYSIFSFFWILGFPCGSAGNARDLGSVPGLGRFPRRRERLPTPVFSPGEFHGIQSMGSQRVIHDWATFTFTSGDPSGKELTCQCRRLKRHSFNPWVGKIPWRRAWQPTPIFLPGESFGQGSLLGYIHAFTGTDTTEAAYHIAHTSYL